MLGGREVESGDVGRLRVLREVACVARVCCCMLLYVERGDVERRLLAFMGCSVFLHVTRHVHVLLTISHPPPADGHATKASGWELSTRQHFRPDHRRGAGEAVVRGKARATGAGDRGVEEEGGAGGSV